jgi:hypothetical protein
MLSLIEIIPDLQCQHILDIMLDPLQNSFWWGKMRDLYTMLAKFRGSGATGSRDNIYALLGISSDACITDLLKANYEKNLQDFIFDTFSFLLNFNQLDSPIYRFFDCTFQPPYKLHRPKGFRAFLNIYLRICMATDPFNP